MGAITGALIKGAEVAIGGSASIIGGAVGGAVGIIVKEAIAPRGTVTEADEQRAIRQWRKEQKDKANKNPNLDYPASRQIVEAVPYETDFTGGQDLGVDYELEFTSGHYDAGNYVAGSGTATISGLRGAIQRLTVIEGYNGSNPIYHDYKDGLITSPVGRFDGSKFFALQVTDGLGQDRIITMSFYKTLQFVGLKRVDGHPDNSGAPPPFYGGQTRGAQYKAGCRFQASDGTSVGSDRIVSGAILSINCSVTSLNATENRYHTTIVHQNTHDPNLIETINLGYNDQKKYATTKYPYTEWYSGTPDNGSNPPIPDNNVYSETQPALPVQPTPSNNLTEITAATPKELAKQLHGLIKAGKIDDAQTTPEVRDELRKLIAADNAIADKTNVVDTLDNNDGYASAYSDGYQDGFTASLEKDRLNAQNKANNLDVAIPKPSTRAKQKPTAVTATANTATQEKVKETTTTTKLYVAGKTPVKETTITDNSTGVKTTTKAHAETGKVISISRTVPAGVTVTKTGVDNTPISKTNTTAITLKGTPSNTGTGVTTIPQVPTTEQAPTIPQIAGGAITTAAIAAAVYSEQGIEKLTNAAAAGTCQTTQPGGCMQKNVVDPINASTGTLFNNFANTALAAQNAAIQAIVQNTNDIVKHGTYGLQAIQEAAGKAWSTVKIDKMLNVINTALLLHNASMLSSDIVSTVAEVIDNSLATIGLKIKDAEGNQIGFTEAIGSSVTNLIKNVIGAENYSQLTSTWTKANNIYSTGMNVLSNVRSLIDTTQDLAETVGENVSVIGNALKKSGVVRENSYPWMPEDLNTESRWLNRLEKIQDKVDIFEDITSNSRDISEELKEMKESSETFKKAIQKNVEEKDKDETRKKTLAQATPEPTEEDEIRFIEEKNE